MKYREKILDLKTRVDAAKTVLITAEIVKNWRTWSTTNQDEADAVTMLWAALEILKKAEDALEEVLRT